MNKKGWTSWITEEGKKTLEGGYLLPNETQLEMYDRVSISVAKYLGKPELADKFYDLMVRNILCPASPVLSNTGTNRGLPISCYSIHTADSVDSIFTKQHELAMLSKNGGGVGIYLGDVRGRGASISGNGYSDGIVSWAKCFDTVTGAINQGSTRRGASALYLPIEHSDIEEFLRIRRPNQDVNRYCGNIHQAVSISDDFMKKVESGDSHARELFREVLKTRFETGEPYIFFKDNVNRSRPLAYKNNNLEVVTSNLCSEILLYTDPEHTFVCCLSSLNLANWDEFQPDDIYYSTVFLDGVLNEFIDKAKSKPGFAPAIRSAEKGRALGLGVLGWHTLLQKKMIPIESFQAMQLNAKIFKTIKEESHRASQDLAKEFGEPEWCKGTGMRNTHTTAIAPTVSNSIISGGVSAGIEPIAANAFSKKTAKGVFIEYNKQLKSLLESKGKNTIEVWRSITNNNGSVQHLDFLDSNEKRVFKTAREIDQGVLIQQAAQRQQFVDQGQSLNLFFNANLDPKEFYKLHLEAWKLGINTLYYTRTSSILKADISSRSVENEVKKEPETCLACEG
jgi:ribonucleoside-diphosphate reductase alpha chain